MLQGILTAFLVTCNCRVLRLYTSPRDHREKHQQLKKGYYKSLRDCEKGQYGVLSITNPNYEESSTVDEEGGSRPTSNNENQVANANLIGGDEFCAEHDGHKNRKTAIIDSPPENANSNGVAGDGKCDNGRSGANNGGKTRRPLRAAMVTGKLSGALSIADIPKQPLPRAV